MVFSSFSISRFSNPLFFQIPLILMGFFCFALLVYKIYSTKFLISSNSSKFLTSGVYLPEGHLHLHRKKTGQTLLSGSLPVKVILFQNSSMEFFISIHSGSTLSINEIINSIRSLNPYPLTNTCLKPL